MEIPITLSSPTWKLLIYWDTLDLAAKRLLHHYCKYSELNLSLHAVFNAKEISSAGFIILVFCLSSWKCSIYLGADAGLPMMSLISKGPVISSSCRTLPDKRSCFPPDAAVLKWPLAVPSLGLLHAPDGARGNSNRRRNFEVRGLVNYANPGEKISRRF